MGRRLFNLFFAFLLLVFLLNSVSSLGIGPAAEEFNFRPGLEEKIDYIVFPNNERDLSVLVQGDFAEYISLSRDRLKGGKEKFFTATLKLPENVGVPGKHRIFISVTEVFDEELAANFIATKISVKSIIDVYVPYPGQYLEIELDSEDVNVGEPVELNLKVMSRGDEDVYIVPRIDIFDSKNSKVETLYFSKRTIRGQETLNLKKVLNTTGYNPGTYKAVALIDYGIPVKDETNFRVGDLDVEILGYSDKVPIQKTMPFVIQIESGWNNNIEGVYADVIFSKNGSKITEFPTSTQSLTPWEVKNITGYFDSSLFEPGFYEANITVFYFGENQGKSTNEVVKVEFFKQKSLMLWYILGGAGLLIIIIIGGIKLFKKNGKKKKRKK